MQDVTAGANEKAVEVRVHVIGAALLTPDEAAEFAAELLAAAKIARGYTRPTNPANVARARRAIAAKRAKATTKPEG
jgi:7-keto-8-aminopelargonate synthetase-like enzyme